MNERKFKRKMGERGSVSLFLVFVYLFVILIFLFGITFPVLQTFTVEVYRGGELVLDQGIDSANKVQDVEVRNSLLGIFQEQKNAVVTNVEILGVFSQYGWFIVAGVILLVLFVQARRQVETQNIV